MRIPLIGLLCLLLTVGVVSAQPAEPLAVPATGETVESPGDGANGVAIWVHPEDTSLSLILGADDNEGLGLYDLSGALLSFHDTDGPIGNVAVRYGFPWMGRETALVAAAVKDQPRVALFTVDADTRTLTPLGAVETGIPLSGVCLYRSPLTQEFSVFAISDEGDVEQHAVEDEDGEVRTVLRRAMSIGTEVEGCAVDDELRRIYFAEEETPIIWRYGAEPEEGTIRHAVDVGLLGRIIEQVEGMSLLAGPDGQGYLLAANEQNDSVLVYERGGDNAFVGEFTLEATDAVDRVSEPNGLFAVAFPLGEAWPRGLLVTSDDQNTAPNEDSNYKLASWGDVAEALGLPAFERDPRTIGQAETIVLDMPSVTAVAETLPVPAGTDAADDPSIWVNPENPEASILIGTDKTRGLVVYDLAGNLLQALDIGRVNNVDLRPGFSLGESEVVLVATTNRTTNSLDLLTFDPQTNMLTPRLSVPSAVEEVYGTCMYRRADDGAFFAFVNSADTGEVEQYALDGSSGELAAEVVRTFVVGSQTEGCVADDANGNLFIGEEGVGLWKFSAAPDADDSRIQLDSTGPDGHVTADVEGMAIYARTDGTGFLIVSSQGNSTFAVYDRQGNHAWLGSFRIIEGDAADAVSGTDGLEVVSTPIGSLYPDGLLVVQDNLNIYPVENQNFKLLSWADVMAALGLQ